MNKEIRVTIVTLIVMVICIVLQSTILQKIALGGVKPDLALLVPIFASLRRGSMVGQVSGFATGFLEDVMNVSPSAFTRS